MDTNVSGRQTIVIAILYNETRDKLLLSRRRIDVHQGGVWEFPGGKSGPGEKPRQTLERELAEELDVIIEDAHPLTTFNYDYPDRKLRIVVWVADNWSGIVRAKEGQPLEWIALDKLHSIEMPPANRVIKKLLNLPPLYLITPDFEIYDQEFLSWTQAFLQNGLKFLQFRSRKSSFPEHEDLVRELAKQCKNYGCRLLYNGTAEQAASLGADGVHLSSASLMDLTARPLSPADWVAASCHDQGELEHAVDIGADFCVLSPVHESISHPEGDILGWQKFKTLAERLTIPVYALGGVKPVEILEARNNGAHGLAMISGVWDAPDPVSIIKRAV